MIGGRRPLQGRKLADRRVRVERPHSPYFRYTGPNQLVAKPAASQPKTRLGRALASVKSLALGRPLASEEEIGERLSKKQALAIFSSDAISSSAYATEEIIRAFMLIGIGHARPDLLAADQHRDRRAPRHRRLQLPPDLHRLSLGRRLVLGFEGELRQDRVARRGVRPDDRLQPHGRRVDLVGGRADLVRGARRRADFGLRRRRRDLPDHDREPARPPGVGQHLRDPDLPVPGQRPADDRHRHVQDRRPRRVTAHRRPSRSRRWTTRPRPSGSSSSCAPSPRVRSP